MTEPGYYLRQDGIVAGPMSLSDLRDTFLQGANSPGARIRRSDGQVWNVPSDLPELSDILDPNAELATSPASPRALRYDVTSEWPSDIEPPAD
ncbi:MAG TPA: hypothetical protein VLC09_21430 [Polyangiaceae bacterium]|nr:hypothetical protein [Polyangiaceae bacterium]